MSSVTALVEGPPRLQAGGTLNPRRHLYLERPQDEELVELLLDRQYVNLLTSRQMGKSSLMVRAAQALASRGVRTASIDLAAELGSPADAGSYFLGLLTGIARDLRIDIDLEDWWRSRGSETVNQRLMRFFREVVAEQIEGPVVIFLDEIDSTLKLTYTDDLFTAIRGMHNERATVPAYERITFCLIGVATPNELIKDRRTTPYNVGRTLELRDFDPQRDDLAALERTLSPDPELGRAMLERVLHWTDGHPYLTLRLCMSLQEIKAATPNDVDRRVEASFRSLERVSNDIHFEPVLRFLETRLTDGLATLNLYQRVLAGKRERDQTTLAYTQLKLSGLVKRNDEGCLVVRNRIYERLFDRRWLASTKPKRVLAEYRRWAIAASVALLVVIGAGGTYYRSVVFPEQQRLAALDALVARNFLITSADTQEGTRIAFPTGASQSVLEEAAPLLKAVGRVTDLSLAGAQVTDVAPLAGLTNLRALDLSGTEVEDITPLVSLIDLRRLNLLLTPLSSLAPIETLDNLQWLEIAGTRVKNLNPVAHLTNIEYLGVGASDVGIGIDIILGVVSMAISSDSLVDSFDKFDATNMRNASFEAAPVDNIQNLGELTKLKWLDIAGTSISSIAPISSLEQIMGLNFASTAINDLASVANFRDLQVLDFSSTQVASVIPLTNLTNLRYLNLRDTLVANIAPLSGLSKLKILLLDGTQVADLTPLANLRDLHVLSVSGEQVADITSLTSLINLRWLLLDYVQLSEEDVARLANFTNLQMLILSNTRIANLAPLANLNTLQVLDLSGTQVADIAPLANLTNLQDLNLSGTQVADVGPLGNLTKLRQLNLGGTRVSKQDVATLKNALAGRGNRSVEIRGPSVEIQPPS